MRDIDELKILSNIDSMINTLEWDAMRSPGKVKQNAAELKALHELRQVYVPAPAKKPAPVKKEA